MKLLTFAFVVQFIITCWPKIDKLHGTSDIVHWFKRQTSDGSLWKFIYVGLVRYNSKVNLRIKPKGYKRL